MDTSFSTPKRFIFNDVDMEYFRNSGAKQELLKFTAGMGRACVSAKFDPENPLEGLSPALAALHGSLTAMRDWMNDFPPSSSGQRRFGDPVFKEWHQRLIRRSGPILNTVLKCQEELPSEADIETLKRAQTQGKEAALRDPSEEDVDEREHIPELSAYLEAAFGHEIRLDYGTGHECSFQVLLLALFKLKCFGETATPERLNAISIWTAYLNVTRKLQTDYMLEPAGSHGVWGLDDYHCLPFYFGACQLQNRRDWTPDIIHDEQVLDEESPTFLYLGCIRYVKSLKKGVPFFEHSPMLNDISQLPTWSKVASGLLKLFEGEVLNKRPVVQHFKFCQLFQADWAPSQTQEVGAPRETFRSEAAAVMPPTRAPWAKSSNTSAAGNILPPTKAPWAK